MKIKLATADDHKLVCSAIRRIVEEVGGIEVVWESRTGYQTLLKAQKMQPDVLMLDYFMPDMFGLELFRRVKRISPKTKVIFLTGASDPFLLTRLFNAGAGGLLIKNGLVGYVDAIKTVMVGKRYIQPDIAAILITCDMSASKLSCLTNKEYEMILMKLRGYTNSAIAECFDVSVKTVCNTKIIGTKKVGVSSIDQLAAMMYKETASAN